MQSNVVRVIAIASVGVAIALSGCSNDSPAGPIAATWAPTNVAVATTAGPENVLSAKISFTVTGGDSVRVSYQADGGGVELTPFQPAIVGIDTVAVLGLR